MREQVLVWSGGLDSTCLLFDLLKNHDKIRLISFHSPGLSSGKEDITSRKYILKILEKYHRGKYTYEVKNIEFMNNWQTCHWFTNLGLLIKKDSEIHMGYIRTDDFWHYKAELEHVFYSIQKIDNLDSKLVYDYEWKTKEQIKEKAKKLGIINICPTTKYIEKKNEV